MKKSGRHILTIFILGFLSSFTHFLLKLFGEFRVFYANALYSTGRCDVSLNQVFAKFRVSEIGICLYKRLLFHD